MLQHMPYLANVYAVKSTGIAGLMGLGLNSESSPGALAYLTRRKLDHLRCELLWLFLPLAFAQSHTRAAAILVDEFDSADFKATRNGFGLRRF
jgi:hypothetical protein